MNDFLVIITFIFKFYDILNWLHFRMILSKLSGHIVIQTLRLTTIVKLIPAPIYTHYFPKPTGLGQEVFTCTNLITLLITFISKTQDWNGMFNPIMFYFPPKRLFIGVRCWNCPSFQGSIRWLGIDQRLHLETSDTCIIWCYMNVMVVMAQRIHLTGNFKIIIPYRVQII